MRRFVALAACVAACGAPSPEASSPTPTAAFVVAADGVESPAAWGGAEASLETLVTTPRAAWDQVRARGAGGASFRLSSFAAHHRDSDVMVFPGPDGTASLGLFRRLDDHPRLVVHRLERVEVWSEGAAPPEKPKAATGAVSIRVDDAEPVEVSASSAVRGVSLSDILARVVPLERVDAVLIESREGPAEFTGDALRGEAPVALIRINRRGAPVLEHLAQDGTPGERRLRDVSLVSVRTRAAR